MALKVLIVGNGPGGVELARRLSGEFEVTIIDRETLPHYSKPLLSHYIAGFLPEEKLFPYTLDWYEENGINLHLGAEAEIIDRSRKVLVASKGDVPYDVLVLATGARARPPSAEGKEHILTIRTLSDARLINEQLEQEGEMTVLGGGFIGLELAGNAAKAGYKVRLVHKRGSLLGLDRELSQRIRENLEKVGVEFHLGENIVRADEEGLRTDRGYIPGKLKVCAYGIISNKELAVRSGIHAGRGILIDDHFRTSAEGVYAIGDCAEYNGIICGTAKGAAGHAKVLANLLLGKDDRYDFEFRSTFFKFADFNVALIGRTRGEGEWLDDDVKVFRESGRVVGAVVLDNVRKAFKLEKSLREGLPID
jgi:NADPH-dependent 2,4-dienoyl-CoA reductase/sulfur reductase-like enzyme